MSPDYDSIEIFVLVIFRAHFVRLFSPFLYPRIGDLGKEICVRVARFKISFLLTVSKFILNIRRDHNVSKVTSFHTLSSLLSPPHHPICVPY